MGTDNLHHKRKVKRDYERKSKALDTRPRILIVCEGQKTEPNYFASFPVKGKLVDVQIEGEGRNTVSLVKKAKSLALSSKRNNEQYDQVWCVFDKDSFADFNSAIQMCEDLGDLYRVAYSNEAFEIWYLLHFEYHTAGYSRTEYARMLSERLGHKYEKNSKTMYAELLDKQPQAIKNAKKLESGYIAGGAYLSNPSTSVYKLVEELNNYI